MASGCTVDHGHPGDAHWANIRYLIAKSELVGEFGRRGRATSAMSVNLRSPYLPDGGIRLTENDGGRRWPLPTGVLVVQTILLLLLWAAYLSMLYGIGPTEDPDPDGYVTYARHLQKTWTLLDWGRLPGYPAVIAVVDLLGAGTLHQDMFWFHLVLSALFFLASSYAVWRLFGYCVALSYAAILGIQSHFGLMSIIMLADFLHVLALIGTTACAALCFSAQPPRKVVGFLLFAVTAGVAMVLHPSTDLRVYVVLLATAAVLLVSDLRHARIGVAFNRRVVATLVGLALMMATVSQMVVRYFQVADGSRTSTVYTQSWLAYRMFLCLPPASPPSDFDVEIERLKNVVSQRQGYPVEAVVPPGHAPEFIRFLFVNAAPIQTPSWRPRLIEHPFALLSCMLGEIKSKYHTIIRNITPFSPLDTDKTFVTVSYPPNTGSARDELFWKYGINFVSTPGIAADTPSSVVREAMLKEIARIFAVVAVTVWGFVLLERRFRHLGSIVVLSLVAWMAALTIALPLETRYLMPYLPLIYLAQAIAACGILRAIWKWAIRSRLHR